MKIKRRRLVTTVVEWLAPFHLTGKWLLLSAAVGVVAGLGAIAFDVADQVVSHIALEGIAGYMPARAAGEHRLFDGTPGRFSAIGLLAVLATGGLLSGALVAAFAREAAGHGTDAAIESFHHKRGYIRPVVPIIKLLASAVTIGTGGSGGREGPIAQIGAGFGSFLATALRLPVRDRRILLAVGMGAGIGAIFRAPLAGALFAAEILYRESDLESEVVVPAAVASTIGYSIFSYWLPAEVRFLPLFGNKLQFRLGSLVELFPLTLLAVALVSVAILYIKCFYGTHDLFKKSRLSPWLRPAIGALIAGALGLGMWWLSGNDNRALAVLGTGYGTLQLALTDPGSVGLGLLVSLAIVKILTTSATIGSGGSGGVFGPSMVIGGCTGAAMGEALHQTWPGLVPNPAIYAVVGMAGFFAGAAHAPISTIVMVTELTGDYGLLVPTMWVSILCFILCRRWTLYDKQVPTRLDSPAHRGDFLVDILEEMVVGDIPLKQRPTVFQGMPLRDIIHLIASNRQQYFPVVDRKGKFVGIFSADDVRRYALDDALWQLANARDVMTTQVVSVSAKSDLNTAMKRFTERNLDELPVLSDEQPRQLLGMLRRKDVIACYNHKLAEFKSQASDDGAD